MTTVNEIKAEAHKLFEREVNKRCMDMVGLPADCMADWDEASWFEAWWDKNGNIEEQDWHDMLWDIFVEANDMDPDLFGDLMREGNAVI